jgi:SAM-dependent methyltransferase
MKCIICGEPVSQIKVGKTPISGYRCKSLKESLIQPEFNLNMNFCNECNLVKYDDIKGAEVILEKLYSEHTATYYLTTQMTEYLTQFVAKLSKEYKIHNKSTILEIGCNSGRLLSLFREKTNCKILGIEPSKAFNDLWVKEKIEVINQYFNKSLSNHLKSRQFDIIVFRHVFEHITDPADFFEGVAEICDKSTKVIIEVPYFVSVIQNNRIDNISYSHRNYFTIRSMNEILKRFKMGISKFELVNTDGGSIVFHISKEAITNNSLLDRITQNEIELFIQTIKHTKDRINEELKNYTKEEIVGYGAGAKGQHLIHILALKDKISAVVDDTPGYENTFIPGTSLEIKSSGVLKDARIKAVINLAPTHSDAIRAKVPEKIRFINVIDK